MHTPAADKRVAILTPDPADGTYADAWPEVLDRLANALAGADVAATPIAWTAHVDDCARLQEFPLVLPLLAWGYHLDHARWLRACRTWQDAGVAMENPADVLAWNSDKRYLETRSEEHTSELQSLMRISYAVFCLKKKKEQKNDEHQNQINHRDK